MTAKKTSSTPSKTTPQERIYRLKNHPFVVPVATFLVLFIVTMAAFIFLGGSTVGPSDSHIVRLHVDGKERTLPSRAVTVGDLLTRAQVSVGDHDVVEPSRDTEITDDNFSVNVYRAHAVTIVDNSDTGKKTSVATYTAQQSPAAIAKQAGLDLMPEDKVTVVSSDNVLQDGIISQKVVVNRATPVNINLYGTPIVVRTHAQTVAEVLAEKNIKPQPSDTVTPTLETPITPNLQIFVLTVGKQITTVEEVVPAPVQTVNDASLAVGKTVVQQAGAAGKKLTTYEIKTENGKEVSRKEIQSVVAIQPVTQIVAKGTKVVNTNVSGDKASILSAAGVAASQQSAADFVISRESGWNLGAHNSGGCLGLGQACPGGKLVNACPNWDSDATCQVSFFTGYANKYGGWQGAQEFWLLHGWW
jgi:uncharacterized protein YabE (DUF348 family)